MMRPMAQGRTLAVHPQNDDLAARIIAEAERLGLYVRRNTTNRGFAGYNVYTIASQPSAAPPRTGLPYTSRAVRWWLQVPHSRYCQPALRREREALTCMLEELEGQRRD